MSSASSSSSAAPPPSSPQYPLNGRVIFVCFLVLFLLALFILALHLYAKWTFRRSYRRRQAFLDSQLQRLDLLHQLPLPQTGLAAPVVASLPTFVYKKMPRDGLECAVCLCEFQENEKGRLLPICRHSFHTDCIDMWFLSHTTCPLCRASADQPSMVNPASVGQSPDAYLLPQAAGGQRSVDEAEQTEQTATRDLSTPNGEEALIGTAELSRRLRGWSWQRSISDTFTQRQGVQFPANVLFWGNHSDVSSRVSAPRLEHGQRGARSLSHIVIDIPRTQGSFLSPRLSSNMHPADHPSTDQAESCSSTPVQQPLKSPLAHLKSFKRLLSREKKTAPGEQDSSNDGGQSGARLLGPEMYM